MRNLDQHVRQVVRDWKNRLRPHVDLFSEAQQKAFLAEQVMSLVLNAAEAEVDISTADLACIYRLALEKTVWVKPVYPGRS